MTNNRDLSVEPPGRRAFETEFDRISEGIASPENASRAGELSQAVSKARSVADQGDFLAAIRLLGDVRIDLTPGRAPGNESAVRPEDVEQALGDLRRALKRAEGTGAIGVIETIFWAAREAAMERRWEAAWALIDEADERMGEAHQPKAK